ncbi:MAG: FeoB-associated Cys-rich membrane protein [Kiritimatiellia bacterium]|jgi:hypothetical protein
MWENLIVVVVVGAAVLFVGRALWRDMRDEAGRGCRGCRGCDRRDNAKGACHGIDA